MSTVGEKPTLSPPSSTTPIEQHTAAIGKVARPYVASSGIATLAAVADAIAQHFGINIGVAPQLAGGAAMTLSGFGTVLYVKIATPFYLRKRIREQRALIERFLDDGERKRYLLRELEMREAEWKGKSFGDRRLADELDKIYELYRHEVDKPSPTTGRATGSDGVSTTKDTTTGGVTNGGGAAARTPAS